MLKASEEVSCSPVAVVDAGSIDGSVIQIPTFSQTVLLGQKEFPSVDALAIFGVEVKFLILHAAMQQLVGRGTVVGQFGTGFEAERGTIVQTAVVQPVGAIAMSCGHLRARHARPVVGGGIATVIDETQLMVLGDVIVRPYPEIIICCHGVNRAVCQGVHSLFVGSRVAPAMAVRVKKIC